MMNGKIKTCLQKPALSNCISIGLLIVRLVMGAAFTLHGWGKMQSPMAWMGPESPVPGFFQLLAAVSEFGGGIGLILGLLTPLCCLGLMCTMLVAVSMHMFVMKDPFVSMTGGHAFELPLLYLVVANLIFIAGPGKYSADKKIFGDRV